MSPQLLMVSGIGPKEELSKHNIEPVAINENVGKNLQDHIMFGPSFQVVKGLHTMTDLAASHHYLLMSAVHYFKHRIGPITNHVADLLSFEKVKSTEVQAPVLDKYPADWPIIQGISGPGLTGNWDNLFVKNRVYGFFGKRFASVLFSLEAPQSRGTVSLKTSDMKDKPVIDPKWLTDEVDQKVALYAFKRARQYFGTKAMKPILKGDEYLPGKKVNSDEAIMTWIKKNMMTVWAASCTCSMRTKEKGGVLDSKLKVYDVSNLRVVDASSFPMLLPGHPQSVVYMLA